MITSRHYATRLLFINSYAMWPQGIIALPIKSCFRAEPPLPVGRRNKKKRAENKRNKETNGPARPPTPLGSPLWRKVIFSCTRLILLAMLDAGKPMSVYTDMQ